MEPIGQCPHGGVQVEADLMSKAHNGAVVCGEVGDHRDSLLLVQNSTINLNSRSLALHLPLSTYQNHSHPC